MIMEMKGASALGAKTARACDSCIRIRARWFCAVDDAFLCHSCDNLVHSANQLASKHERVRLPTSSSKVSSSVTSNKITTQTWHSGFTRKARTPRHNKNLLVQQQHKFEEEKANFSNTNNLSLVPELGSEEPLLDYYESEEHVLCCVPVFDPFDSDLCNIYNEVKDEKLDNNNMRNYVANEEEEEEETFDLDNFSEFLPLDTDLAELAADVESSLLDCKEEDEIAANVGVRHKGANAMVKVKDEKLEDNAACHHLESVLDITTSEACNWNIDIESLVAAEEEEEAVAVPVPEAASGSAGKVGTEKEKFLRLNYEEVITAWASQGSPWTTENPPETFNFDDCWPDYLGSSGRDVQCSYGEVRSLRGYPMGSVDEGREARVSRYREKRRTRLFSKKIRYEVRKLNAEKRPRMKGRFVKRASFVGATTFPA